MKKNFKKCIICGSEDKEKLPFDEHYYKDKFYPLVKCLNCGLFYRSLQPDKKIIQKLYEDPFYFDSEYRGGVENSYVENEKTYLKEAKRFIKKIKKYKRSGKLLEIGCAGGYFLKAARKAGYDVMGVEISKEMCDFANNRLRLKVLNGFFEDIDFGSEKFDIIYGAHVLEHMFNPLDSLKKIKKMLKPDGILVIEVPATFNYSMIGVLLGGFKVFKNALKGKIKFDKKFFWYIPQKFETKKSPPYHLFEFTPKTIRNLFRKAELNIIESKSFDAYPKKGKFSSNKAKIIKFLNHITHLISYKIRLFNWGDRVIIFAKNKNE